MLNPYSIMLDLEKTFYSVQLWRLITTYCFAGTFSMNFIFTMLMLFYTFKACEESYAQKYPEFVWMLVFNAFATFVYSWIYGNHFFLMSAFEFSVLYVFCKNEPDRPMSIWGFPVTSGMLPWVLVAFSIVSGGDPFTNLIGIAAGHTYIFLKLTLPSSHGYNLLFTPKLVEKWVNEVQRRSNLGRGNVQNLGGQRVNLGGAAAAQQAAEARARPFQGRGVRLGGE
eukprot:403373270